MPPQRSQQVASCHGLGGKAAKPVRGQRGYRKHRSGFLNVEPIGSEVQVGLENMRDSPLLRLPAEIRNQIWSFALGESPIRMAQRFLKPIADGECARWNLLRVCRQTYLETAMIPYTSITIFLAILPNVSRFLKSTRIQHIQKIHVGAWPKDMNDRNLDCARFFSSDRLMSLQKVKVTLWTHDDSEHNPEAERLRVQELLEMYLPGKEIEICWEYIIKYFRRWH